jgi:hypothetical protein
MNKNTSCPLCRTVLIESSNEENDDNDDDDDDEDDDEDEDIDDEDDNELCDVENVIERFEKKGFGITELMCIILERRSKTNTKYNKEYVDKITDEFHEMVIEMDAEMFENICMGDEDIKI